MTFAQKVLMEKQAAFEVGLHIGRQQTIDFLQLALQKRNGWGEKRLWDLLMEISELQDEFHPAFDIKNPECDYYRDLMDRCLAQNCGKAHPLVPFSDRYEYLKNVTYGGKRK